MSDAEWKNRCASEWGLLDAPMPDGLDWKSVYEAEPFGRNFLRNPSPYGSSRLRSFPTGDSNLRAEEPRCQ